MKASSVTILLIVAALAASMSVANARDTKAAGTEPHTRAYLLPWANRADGGQPFSESALRATFGHPDQLTLWRDPSVGHVRLLVYGPCVFEFTLRHRAVAAMC